MERYETGSTGAAVTARAPRSKTATAASSDKEAAAAPLPRVIDRLCRAIEHGMQYESKGTSQSGPRQRRIRLFPLKHSHNEAVQEAVCETCGVVLRREARLEYRFKTIAWRLKAERPQVQTRAARLTRPAQLSRQPTTSLMHAPATPAVPRPSPCVNSEHAALQSRQGIPHLPLAAIISTGPCRRRSNFAGGSRRRCVALPRRGADAFAE